MTPGSAALILLFAVPLVLLVAYSFGSTNVVGQPVLDFNFRNYAQVLQPYNLAILIRTVIFAVLTTVACLLIGYPYAYFAARFGGRVRTLLVVLVVVPWLVSYLVRVYAWAQILGFEGMLNEALGVVGIPPVQWIGTPFAVVVGLTFSYLPLMILPLYASILDVDSATIEAGKDLFGTPVATFFHVTLPATRTGIVGGIVLVFLPVLGDFATAQFLGGAQTTMLGNIIADQFISSGSATLGSALAVTLIVLLLITGLIGRLILSRRAKFVDVVMMK